MPVTFSIPDDFTFFANAASDATAYHVPTGDDRVRYDELTGAGEGEVIAVLDTGINSNHPDFAGKLLGVFSEVPGESGEDLNGHGTHVAGTSFGPKEICLSHKAKGISIKVLGGRDGSGLSTWIAAGIRRARLWEGPDGERVTHINLSLGGGNRDAQTEREIELCEQAGIIVNAAAGNDGWRQGTDRVNNPARSTYTIAVGALDQNENIAAFTSGGPLVDTAAAGVGVVSSQHTGGRVAFSGTSMATPVTSSKSASTQSFLVRNGFSRLTGTLGFRSFLESNSRDIFSPGEDDATGSGVFDVYEQMLEDRPDDVTILASRPKHKSNIKKAAIGFLICLLSFGMAQAQETVEVRTVVTTSQRTDVYVGEELIEPGVDAVINTAESKKEITVIDVGIEVESITVIGTDLNVREVSAISPGKFALEPGNYLVSIDSLPDLQRFVVSAPKPEFDLTKIAPAAAQLSKALADLPTRVNLATAYESAAKAIADADLEGKQEGWASSLVKEAALEVFSKRKGQSQYVDWVNGFQRPLQKEILSVGFTDSENYRLALLEVVKGLREGLEQQTVTECDGTTCFQKIYWIEKVSK